MTSVARNDRLVKEQTPVRTFRMLTGVIDGQSVFRIAPCRPEPLTVQRRPGMELIEAGWFSADLLDE